MCKFTRYCLILSIFICTASSSFAAEETKVNQPKGITSFSDLYSDIRLQLAEKNKLDNDSEIKLIEKRSLLRRMIVSILFIAFGLAIFLAIRYGICKLEKSITPKNVIRESGRILRLKTLGNLARWLSGIVVFSLVLLAILNNFGVDTTVFLASAGIIGLAVGFGGQYLIRDIITGIFIIIEGQYNINDVVKIGDLSGLVQDINLRVTTLRDIEGNVIIIPNGEIKTIINFTRGFSYAVFDLGIDYKENVDQVMEVIKQLGKEMREDKTFQHLVLDDLEMLGVDAFQESQVILKFRIKTLPIKQWDVAREFRRRIKNKFDELGIEMPFPHRTVYLETSGENEWLKGLVKHASERE